MFGGGSFWGGPVGDANGSLNKERNPPKRPIAVEFPSYVPAPVSDRLDSEQSSRLRDRVCHIRSFAEITEGDIGNFNIHLQQDAELADMIPDASLSSRPLPFDNDLEAMLAEVAVNNEDAFREVLRMEPLAGRKKPRLAYARNFFGNLEDMARYWDNSNDNYYFVPKTKPTEIKPVTPTASASVLKAADGGVLGDQTNTSSADQDTDMREVYTGYRLGNGEDLPSGSRVAMVKNFLKIVMHKFTCRDHEPMPSPREKFFIRGVNIQSIHYNCCVARIPLDTQLARKRMLEGPLMGVHVRDDIRFKSKGGQDKGDPLIESATTDTSSHVHLKANELEGRKHATKPAFKGPPFVGEKFDLLREVGAMLILARQREREGKSNDSISGNNKWWVTEQRWGGGPLKWGQMAYEQYEDEDPSWSPAERALQEQRRTEEQNLKNGIHDSVGSSKLNSMSVDDLMANNAPSIPAAPGDPIAGPRKKKLRSLTKPPGKDSEMREGRPLMYVPIYKKRWYMDWAKLRPNTSTRDEKLIYTHIGKRHDSEFDDIFLLNGVNHHIGVTHMRVHPDYLRWLETGEPVGDEEVEPGLKRNVLYVWRSRWYDMFDVQARCELLVGLWKIMCWLNREFMKPSEGETTVQGAASA